MPNFQEKNKLFIDLFPPFPLLIILNYRQEAKLNLLTQDQNY